MAAPLNLANIQGDILVGLSKETELFYFFQIVDVNSFRSQLSNLIPLITTSEHALKDRSDIRKAKLRAKKPPTQGDGETPHPDKLSVVGVNLAFSQIGINKLDIADKDRLDDTLFKDGMRNDAFALGDNGEGADKASFKPDWDATFLKDIHGVILVTGDCHDTINKKLEEVKGIFVKDGKSSINEVDKLVGDVRPNEQRGHEHFGYKDGISQPKIQGVESVPELRDSQPAIEPSIILLGHDDRTQPDWAIDGSLLAFRKLPQKVPEFDKFLVEAAPAVLDPTAKIEDLLGARLVGRWKSGAPIVKAQLVDNPDLGNDNSFTFTENDQAACPFASHVRKMNPRGDVGFDGGIKPHLILRRGIPFGPEVTDEEKHSHTTKHERGLYFVSYQSDLSQGFSFLQKSWSNNATFPPTDNGEKPGLDAIIGQTRNAGERIISGADLNNTGETLPLTAQWVNSKGGEYFFSPSISALKQSFATNAA